MKVDISQTSGHMQIDPGDIDLLGLHQKGKLYLDLSLPLAFRLGVFFFIKVTYAVRIIMNKNGHNALLNYIDDLIYCGLPSTISRSYQFLLDLLQELGLYISNMKLCPPRSYAWVYYSTPLIELCQFLIVSYRKFAKYVIVVRIREW